ncbi:pyoverdine biosynthesis protein [Pseudomonas aeruginosa]|nr:pyoverdine biosynthesis protein [Pseudomonas aeruginosa]
MNAYVSDQPVRLSPLRDEQGNQPRFGLQLEPGRPACTSASCRHSGSRA